MDEHGVAIEDTDTGDCTVIAVPHDSIADTQDFPPESFWLSKDAEFDWFDRNAFLERKESTKGNFSSTNLNPTVNSSHSNPSSQRYPVNSKSKAAIIGLPKTQKTTYVDLKCRQCKAVNVRLFPKTVGKAASTDPVTEPSSPKVSCIGRVRSKRCPIRRNSSVKASEPVQSTNQRSGLISRVMALFRCKGRRRRRDGTSSSEKVNRPAESCASRRICVSVKPVNSEPGTPSEPGGLGGMMRFASGRRSDYLGRSGIDDMAENHLDFRAEVCPT